MRRGPNLPHGIAQVKLLPGNVGYLELRSFEHFEFGDRRAPARNAVDSALAELSHTEAMIIDLRENGGGSPHMVGYLSSAFTEKGADIYNTFHYRQGTASEAPREWHAQPRLDVPLFVLISARTGSAAEAFAYTLQQAGRASIVGETSAGAANPGDLFRLGDGYSIFISTGTPINPISRRNWETTGVVPDHPIAAEKALDQVMQLAKVTAPSNEAEL
nr:S41 family peptidase [Pseudomarimonas arenosa]